MTTKKKSVLRLKYYLGTNSFGSTVFSSRYGVSDKNSWMFDDVRGAFMTKRAALYYKFNTKELQELSINKIEKIAKQELGNTSLASYAQSKVQLQLPEEGAHNDD